MNAKPLLLIIDDDETIRISLSHYFDKKGYTVVGEKSASAGLRTALREIPDVILLDLRLPDMNGIEMLGAIKREYPEIPVIMMTGFAEVDDAVKSIKLGAEYYFKKPVDLEELSVLVEKSLGIRAIKQNAALARESPYPIAGRSKQTQGLILMINLLADNSSTTVLIQGETGTGKELVARNIHLLGSRAEKPFVDINCAAIPEHIVESELFGYEAGAFTDARKTKKGLFEVADGGTIFLDEIGDMPKNVQAKILRVLESKTLKRLGGTRDIPVDVRVIAATNRDLQARVASGAFREDLFYRLNVMPLSLSPLRERVEDIPIIAEFLLHEIKTAMGKKEIVGFRAEVLDLFCAYSWPGNARELRNVVERAAILCSKGEISREHVALPNQESQSGGTMTLAEVERVHIRKVLELTGGNRTRSAQILGIARSTLNEKIKIYRLQ